MQLSVERWQGLTSFDSLPDPRLIAACEGMLAGMLDKPVEYVDSNGDIQKKVIDFTVVPYNPNTEMVNGVETTIDPDFDPSEDEIMSKMVKYGDEVDLEAVETLKAGTIIEYEDMYGNDEEFQAPFDLPIDWNVTLYLHIHGERDTETCYYNRVDVKLVKTLSDM